MSTPLRAGAGDTRRRLLEATESLFIECGYEAMSLRQITARAHANLAAVNYHFGSKEALMHELLSQRLDRLNLERLNLLSSCEKQWPENMDATAVFAMLFIPAFRISHESVGGKSFMRLLGRVYSDRSPFVRGYLQEHYQPIFGRFFEAFSRTLPDLPRNELGLRLHFGLKALSGILAGEDMQKLIDDLSMGQTIGDGELLARLISLISPILTAPFGSEEQIRVIEQVLQLDNATAENGRRTVTEPVDETRAVPGILEWLKEGRLAL
ncbi:TetR/AcrR family transcriptional regulator [Rhodanobacter sp. BL-MT-08]